MKKKDLKEDTEIAHIGREPDDYFGLINSPPGRASSILFPNLKSYLQMDHPYIYGRIATPLSKQFEKAITALEEGYDAISAPSGMAAITVSLLAFLRPGDHLLVTDSLYESARRFCDNFLSDFGIDVEYYDPLIGGGISKLIKKNTKVIYMESPGSGTFDVQDVPAIVKAAKKKNIVTMLDNSWATGVIYRPLDHGVDISIISATKYISGHSDLMLGAVVSKHKEHHNALKAMVRVLGICPGSEELYLALRGLRTLELRLNQHALNALKIAKWLQKRPEVQKIYYPPLPSDPGHEFWKRDFKGANGLLTFVLKPSSQKAVENFADALELFPVAASWGGFESLLQPQNFKRDRSAIPWKEKGFPIRLHIGLEDPDDLIADLEQAFKKFK